MYYNKYLPFFDIMIRRIGVTVDSACASASPHYLKILGI